MIKYDILEKKGDVTLLKIVGEEKYLIVQDYDEKTVSFNKEKDFYKADNLNCAVRSFLYLSNLLTEDFGMTVNELLYYTLTQIYAGNGNKKVILSDDDELNGTHQCFQGYQTVEELNKECEEFGGCSAVDNYDDNYILLS